MTIFSRRASLKGMAILGGMSLLNTSPKSIKEKSKISPFTYCFNTSCIMGQNLGIEKDIEIAAKAGYDGLELWLPAINKYKEEGKSLKDLGNKIADLGLKVEDGIGFAQWIVDDETTRKNAVEQLKREMDSLAQLGSTRIAAPPSGATEVPGLDLDRAGDRFRAILEIGLESGVIPHLELWGFSKNLSNLSELLYVAAACGHPETKLLTDVYHLHKGGSSFQSLKLIAADAIEIFHINDYPETPDRMSIKDADRVFPGEGVAPLDEILNILAHNRDKVVLSLELFNQEYYRRDALEVAKEGLRTMKNAVANAGF